MKINLDILDPNDVNNFTTSKGEGMYFETDLCKVNEVKYHFRYIGIENPKLKRDIKIDQILEENE